MAKRKEDLRQIDVRVTFEWDARTKRWRALAEMTDRSGAFPIHGLAEGRAAGATQAVAGQEAVRNALDNYRRG